MAKIVIFLVLCALIATIKAQDESQPQDTNAEQEQTTLSPEDQVTQFKDVALKIIAKRLAVANLPPELQADGQQILSDAANGLDECEENLKNNHLIWQYKVCAAAQLRNALSAISLLQIAAAQPVSSSA